MNTNLKMRLDALVEAMKASNNPAGAVRLVLRDGTECALILSVDTDATNLLVASLQVIASQVGVSKASFEAVDPERVNR